ncbi:hypothetical protein [Rubinisphaera margarita]|uniref:hypothetical protein n=1 Tax=Rubinisphaera margarita TaxID=2909586 RepID=UPI001EE80AE5|nr:hypothetical protein [Rubinisphaera margarita]MCG6157686.1 hypothetical protein [Rubinisphaera margarita]
MLRKSIKLLLVGTAMAPVLVVMGVDQLFRDGFQGWASLPFLLFVIAASLFLIAICVMHVAKKSGEKMSLRVCKAKNSDKEVITFLVAYLLPVLSDHEYLFREINVPTLFILALVSIAVYHSNAFDFNPLLGMLGYHFYEVEDDDHFPYLLISSTPIKKPCQELRVTKLFEYTFLHIED